jgi:phosphatidylglycerol---prolipoprotein diacylglyceryl transferase
VIEIADTIVIHSCQRRGVAIVQNAIRVDIIACRFCPSEMYETPTRSQSAVGAALSELYSDNRIMPDLAPSASTAGGSRRFPQSLRQYRRKANVRSGRRICRADLTPYRPQRICMRPMPTLVLPFPAINPVIVQWGPLAIRWYALAYIGGLVLGWLLIRRIVSDDRYWNGKKRPSADTIDDLLVYCAFGVIIGGRLGNVLFYDPQYYFSHPIEVFKVWEGGMAFHGGLIGALIGALLFCRRYKAPVMTVFDLCSLVAPIGIFLGRIANFIRPELWGRPTDVPWAVIFPGTDGQPRHPSQIYEALLEGVLAFAILYALAQMGALRRPGLIAGVFAIVYGAARIFSEFFREPDPRLEALGRGLTMGMVLSLPLIIAGVGMLAWSYRRGVSP